MFDKEWMFFSMQELDPNIPAKKNVQIVRKIRFSELRAGFCCKFWLGGFDTVFLYF